MTNLPLSDYYLRKRNQAMRDAREMKLYMTAWPHVFKDIDQATRHLQTLVKSARYNNHMSIWLKREER